MFSCLFRNFTVGTDCSCNVAFDSLVQNCGTRLIYRIYLRSWTVGEGKVGRYIYLCQGGNVFARLCLSVC